MDERQELRSLKKALNALCHMNQEGEATVASLAAAIGVPRTTATRLLESLAVEGYIEKAPRSRYYRLTNKVLRLSSGFQEESILVETATPMLKTLGKEIGWALSLSTPKASEMVVRVTTNFDTAMILSRHSVGYRVPILYTTTGLCFLALCSEAERNAVLGLARDANDPREQLANNPELLASTLSRIRDNGFCMLEYPEFREGNVGVPLTIYGRVVGGIVMRYLKSAMQHDKMFDFYVPMLKKPSQDIQRECEARLDDRAMRRGYAAVAPAESYDRGFADLH